MLKWRTGEHENVKIQKGLLVSKTLNKYAKIEVNRSCLSGKNTL